MSKSTRRLNRLFDKLERRIPRTAADWLARLRRPEARWLRIPLGILRSSLSNSRLRRRVLVLML